MADLAAEASDFDASTLALDADREATEAAELADLLRLSDDLEATALALTADREATELAEDAERLRLYDDRLAAEASELDALAADLEALEISSSLP